MAAKPHTGQRSAQRGLSLVELMIALALGLVVIGGTIALYILSVGSSTDTIRAARLNFDLDSAMSLMANDIRRAGFHGGAVDTSFSSANPFMDADASDGVTADLTILSAGSCVLYTYDGNQDGALDSTEFYGFRRNATQQTLEIRRGGTTTNDCTDGTWETLDFSQGSDAVEITELQFSLAPIVDAATGVTLADGQTKCLDKDNNQTYDSTCLMATLSSGTNAVETRAVNILLAGRVARDPAVTKTLSSAVKVRNDRVFLQP